MTCPRDGPEARVEKGDFLRVSRAWPSPHCIVSDGAYGVGGFPGDPRTPEGLPDWYRPHVEEWSRRALPSTTLWLWNTEIGWATVHPLLAANGWEYVQTIVWDKGIAHVAGNVNGDTIRKFPVVTEVCALYRRRLELRSGDALLPANLWLRHEWRRAGLRLWWANAACGVKSAATRKYFARDWLWYPPPPEVMARLVAYANVRGDPAGRPYFSLDGRSPVGAEEWARLRHPWTHGHALTNVWTHPPLRGRERVRGRGKRLAPRIHRPGRTATLHLNQKPLELMRRILLACTRPGDVAWEPFGGLCSAVVAARELGRHGFAAELVPEFYEEARARLEETRWTGSGAPSSAPPWETRSASPART